MSELKMNTHELERQCITSKKFYWNLMFHDDNNHSTDAQSPSTMIEWRIICVCYAEGDYSFNYSAELK